MKRIVWLAVALLLIAPASSAGDAEHPAPPPVDDARFDFLKGLVGTWIGPTPEDGTPAPVFEFRLTAGGSAIEEHEFLGSPMEMLTVYNMEGTDLVATHYCMLGNQPRAVAAKRVKNNALTFDCAGKPGNSASHDDQHVHGWSIRQQEDGTLHYTAEIVKAGEVAEAPDFVLTREDRMASR